MWRAALPIRRPRRALSDGDGRWWISSDALPNWRPHMWQTGSRVKLCAAARRLRRETSTRGRATGDEIASTHARVALFLRGVFTPRALARARFAPADSRAHRPRPALRRRSRDAAQFSSRSPLRRRGSSTSAAGTPVRRATSRTPPRSTTRRRASTTLRASRGAAETHMVATLLRGRVVLERSGRSRDHRPGRRGAGIRRALLASPASFAQKHGAALIALEHRFYGQSHPTANMSAANLVHLDAEQALADAAQFIWWWSEQHKRTTRSFISWGGSYAGQLAAWMRLRYPTSVAGAVAFSAPVLAQLDFYQYNRVVTDVVRAFGGAGCVQLLEDAFAELTSTLKSGAAGRTRAARILKACNVTKTDDDDATLRGSASGAIQSLVQYNEHGIDRAAASFCAAGASASSNGSTPLEALGAMLASLERSPGLLHALAVRRLHGAAARHQLHDRHADDPPVVLPAVQRLRPAGLRTQREGLRKGCARPHAVADGAARGRPAGGGPRALRRPVRPHATPPAAWSGHQRGWTNVRNGGRSRCRMSSLSTAAATRTRRSRCCRSSSRPRRSPSA